MDERESVALNALRADVSATSLAPAAVLVEVPAPGQSITGPVTILTGAFDDVMAVGPTNTRTLDDNAFPGGCAPGYGPCTADGDPDHRSGTKTVTEHGCPTGTCEGLETENVTVAGNPGQIFTQTTLATSFHDSSISVDIELKTYGEIHDATTHKLVYRIDSTGTGRITGEACPDASGRTALHLEFSAKENYFIAADPAGGSGGYGLEQTYAGDVAVKVDDNANMVGIDIAVKAHAESKGGGKAAGATQSDLRTFSNDAAGTQTFGYDAASGFTEQSDTRKPTSADGLFFITHGMDAYLTNPAKSAAKAAEKAWQSGMCIRVTASPNGGEVDKSSVTNLRVVVKQRYEGTELDKPVEGTISGVASLDPAAGKQPAPATFRYTAGSSKGDKGQLAFRSVSNRGIGHTSVEFSVRDTPREAKGVTGTVTFEGTSSLHGAAGEVAERVDDVTVSVRMTWSETERKYVDAGSTFEFSGSSHTTSPGACEANDRRSAWSNAAAFADNPVEAVSIDLTLSEPARAQLVVYASADMHGHSFRSDFADGASPPCVNTEEDFEQTGNDWLGFPTCLDADGDPVDGLFGTVSADGTTVDLSCSSTVTNPTGNGGSTTETARASGTLTFH
ncbi:MAG: hypothetical protein ACJ77B_05440 [Chloroflexota bacterium]